MTMHDNLHVLLRHAWVFSVDPRRDLFLRTCFVRTELCGFAAEEWDCPQQSVYHVITTRFAALCVHYVCPLRYECAHA